MLSIQTLQAGAWNAIRQMNATDGLMSRSVQRLSSGLRVNSARDDAAGLAISSRMGSNLSASSVVSRGLNDGIGLVQTADGGLQRIQDALQRARELAVQARNGALGSGDRAALDAEYQQMMQQADGIAQATSIFGLHPLLGQLPLQVPGLQDLFGPGGGTLASMPSGIRPIALIPAGTTGLQIDIDGYPGAEDDIQIFTQSGRHLVGTPLDDAVWSGNGVNTPGDVKTQVMQPAWGFAASAQYDGSQLLSGTTAFGDPTGLPANSPLALNASVAGMHIAYSGDGDRFDVDPNNGSTNQSRERLRIDNVTEPLVLMVVGAGVFGATASWTGMPAAANLSPQTLGPYDITVDAGIGQGLQTVSVPASPADVASLGVSGSAVATPELAARAIDALDAALQQVGDQRATLGAIGNRFGQILEQAAVSREALSAARGRIVDADFAQATADLVSAQVLRSAGSAMVAQADGHAKKALAALMGDAF